MLIKFCLLLASCFKIPQRKAFITESLSRMPPPNTTLDFIVYNTSDFAMLEPESLDTLLVDTSNMLNTMGVVFFNACDDAQSTYYYDYLLKNPEELWNYNLVSIGINGSKITARKGSSVIFKTRKMLEFSNQYKKMEEKLEEEEEISLSSLGFIKLKTGNPETDWALNLAGYILQYTILFNFFSFGIFVFITTFLNNRNY